MARLERCRSQAIPDQTCFPLKPAAPLVMPMHWAEISLPLQVVLLLGGPKLASMPVTTVNPPGL